MRTILVISVLSVLVFLASSPLEAKVKGKTTEEMFAESELVIEGTTMLVEHDVPGYGRLRQIAVLVNSVIMDSTSHGTSVGDTLSILQLRPSYSDTTVYDLDPRFAPGDYDSLFLWEIVDPTLEDFDGSPIPIPAGTYYWVRQGHFGKRPVGGAKGNFIERLDGPAPGEMLEEGSLPAPRREEERIPVPFGGPRADDYCCIYIDFDARAFDDLTANAGKDINFSAADKAWIKTNIVTKVTADYTSVKVKGGGSGPNGEDILGRAPDSKPGGECISGKTVHVWSQEFGFEDGDNNWAETKEKMAQAIANIVTHEAGHQFGLAHGGHSAPNDIMHNGGGYTHLGSTDQALTAADNNKIKECCCKVACVNKYANFTGVDRLGEGLRASYEVKYDVKVTSVSGTVEKWVDGQWKPVKLGDVLASGTKVRIQSGSKCEVKPTTSKLDFEGALAYVELTDGTLYVCESGLCDYGEHCAISTPIAEGWIDYSDDTIFTTMGARYDSLHLIAWYAGFLDNDFDVVTTPVVGPDSGTVHLVGPGTLIEYDRFGNHMSHGAAMLFPKMFGATGFEGYVSVDWWSFQEIGIVGFDVLRALTEEGPYERINGDLIGAEGGSSMGAIYQFVDEDVVGGVTYHYQIRGTDLFGDGHVFGPFPGTPIGGGGLPAAVCEIQDGRIPLGTEVFIGPAVVTAVDRKLTTFGFWVQELVPCPEYPGGEYSGILVYMAGASPDTVEGVGIEVGDVVAVRGEYDEYFGHSQITSPVGAASPAVSIVEKDYGQPDAVALTVHDLGTDEADSANCERWEGVWCRVDTILCTEWIEPLSNGEWMVVEVEDFPGLRTTDSLRVDDKLGIPTLDRPDPGDRLATIYGVFAFEYGNYKLWPRSDEDVIGIPTASVDEDAEFAERAELRAYPNPFNPTATIEFGVTSPGAANLAIFDVRGRRIRVLVDETLPQGIYRVRWDGRDSNGLESGPGIYFCRLVDGNRVEVRKLVLAK